MGPKRGAGWGALALAVALCACSEQQSTYTFEACPLADGVCSRDITLACAVNTLDARYSGCSQATDCVEPPQFEAECVPVTFCRRRLINRLYLEQYVTEVGREIERYCNEINCGWFTDDVCEGPPGNVIACVEGQCRFLTEPPLP